MKLKNVPAITDWSRMPAAVIRGAPGIMQSRAHQRGTPSSWIEAQKIPGISRDVRAR